MSRRIEFLTKTNEVRPGSKHPVVVRITLDRATKVRGIHARFFAAERTEAVYTERYTDSKGKRKTRTRTAVEHVAIADEYYHLAGDAQPGFFAVVGDALAAMVGGGNHEIMQPGEYEFPLEINLPDDCPPSFEGKKCSVFYRLEVRIDIPIWPDPKRDHNFQVLELRKIPRSEPAWVRHPNPQKGRGFWDKMFGKDVKADVALDRDILVPGESFACMVQLVPNEPIELDGIVVGLVGEEKTVADGHNDTYPYLHEFPMIETPTNLSKPFSHEFEFVAPDLGLYTSHGENFEINWSVKVRLDVPWAVDPVITIPIGYFEAQ